jgi:hypothetical protein
LFYHKGERMSRIGEPLRVVKFPKIVTTRPLSAPQQEPEQPMRKKDDDPIYVPNWPVRISVPVKK